MPLFSYKALGAGGRTVTGEIAAESDRQARALLRESGVVPVSMTEKGEEATPRRPALGWMAAMTRQLGTLLRAGFPMDRALSSLALSSSDPAMKAVLTALNEGVSRGMSLSETVLRIGGARATSRGPDTGWAELAAMVEAGEASGELAEVLVNYADLLEKRVAFRRRLQSALFYPLVILTLAVSVVIFLFVYVVPTITRLFEGSNMPLPLPTRLLFLVSDVVTAGFWPAIVVLVVAFLLGRGYFKSRSGRRRVEKMLFSLPGFGRIMEKASFARWGRTFGFLLGNGVEILAAMGIAARTARSPRIEEATESARPRVAEGVPLARALSETGVFPLLALEAVSLGEGSGTLPQLLTEMAGAWEAEVEASAARFADLLEPLVLVVMGAVVGGIVLAILLPIFEFNSAVK